MSGNISDDSIDRLLREAAISDLIKVAGLEHIDKDTAPQLVLGAVKKLAAFLAGADKLLKQACAVEAVKRLRGCGIDVESARRYVRTALQGDGTLVDDATFRTFGETSQGATIVDIVQRETGELAWAVAWPASGKVEIVDTLVGRTMWPRSRLPWTGIPYADAVERAWQDDGPDGKGLFLELTDVLRQAPIDAQRHPRKLHVVLPEPQGVWATTLALWIMASYLAEQFHYFPALLMEGSPELGKTRLAKLLLFLARRGMVTPSPTPASLFRMAEYHLVGLALDVKDLPSMMKPGSDFENLVLGRFERDQKVPRVRTDAQTPIDEVRYHFAYGPSIFISNVRVRDDDPLIGRTIRIAMPEAGDVAVHPAIRADSELALSFRARLVAWAARVAASGMLSGTSLPDFVTGRLGDITRPLIQVAQLVFPDGGPAIAKLLESERAAARDEAIDTWEGKLLVALVELQREGFAPGGEVGFAQVIQRIEGSNRPIPWRDSSQTLGKLCANLHIKTARRGKRQHRQTHIIYPSDAVMNALCRKYGVPTDQGKS